MVICMHTVCLLNQKGGAGKSTVVQSLAVCADQHGQNTLIVELDPQGTLKDWSNRREATQPEVYQTLPQSVGDVLDDARNRGVEWVFIDTPGHHNPAAAAAAAHADVVLIPCKILSMKDVDAILPTINEAGHAKKPTFVVMNQVPPNAPKLVRRRQVSIQKHYDIQVLSLCLSRRADFEYCDAFGQSAAEFNPQGAAAAEIEKLYVLLQTLVLVAKSAEPAIQRTSSELIEATETSETIDVPETTETIETTEAIEVAEAIDSTQPAQPETHKLEPATVTVINPGIVEGVLVIFA